MCVNYGSDTLTNKMVIFVKDRSYSFVETPANATITGNTVKWTISHLMPEESQHFSVHLKLAAMPVVNMGDTLTLYAFVDSSGDVNPGSYKFMLRHRVTGSYDPNDKQEMHGGYVTTADVAGKTSLLYTINFQNTGSNTAFNIIIKDTLYEKLDTASFEMLASDHPYHVTVTDGKYVQWEFKNIWLPDSVHNEAESHGYITYSVKVKNNLAVGDTVKSSASIYFDLNPPVLSSQQLTIIQKVRDIVWTGIESTDWMNPHNWNTNEIPNDYSDITIPDAVPDFPELNSDAGCYSLRVGRHAALIVKPGFKLQVNGK